MDLADQIDDYICSFEGLGDITMDSLAMFIFIWAVLALFIVWLCKFVYSKYFNKEQNSTTTNSTKLNGDKPKRLSEPKEILASKEVKVNIYFVVCYLFLFIKILIYCRTQKSAPVSVEED